MKEKRGKGPKLRRKGSPRSTLGVSGLSRDVFGSAWRRTLKQERLFIDFGVILRSLFGRVSTFSAEKSTSGVVFARFLDILFQSLFLSRFFIDFGKPNEGKTKQNHWRVVQNRCFDVLRKKNLGPPFLIHFGRLSGPFWLTLGSL